MKNDRLTAGALAGALATIVQHIYGLITKYSGISDRGFNDYAEVIVMFKKYSGVTAQIVGLISHLAFGIILGALYAYLISVTSSRYYLLKGILFSIVVWFGTLVVGTMFRFPLFTEVPPSVAIVTLIGALIFGLVTGYTLKYLENKFKLV